jgi:hypothetical protein
LNNHEVVDQIPILSTEISEINIFAGEIWKFFMGLLLQLPPRLEPSHI